jgi:hypothetical protein
MTRQRNRLGTAIDAGASLLAGGSAAFVLFAMPEAALARMFAACGLASFSPKFQPPFTASLRLGLVALGGLAVLAFVWSLMKALDRAPATAAAAKPVHLPEPEADAPRLRKADAHPDAPARRPLMAGRDLGEPLDLDPADAVDEDWTETSEAEEDFIPQPETIPPAAEILAALPPFLVPQEEAAEAEPEPEPEPEYHPVPAAAEEEESIVALMHRFETGLVRKKQALADRSAVQPVPPPTFAAPTYAPPPEPEAPPAPAPVGHRLRSAIADLQKVAGR